MLCFCAEQQWQRNSLSQSLLLLAGAQKREHITPICASLHMLPIYFRVHLKMFLFIFNALNGLASLYLSELFHLEAPPQVPKTKRMFRGSWAFSVASLGLWLSVKCYNCIWCEMCYVNKLGLYWIVLHVFLFTTWLLLHLASPHRRNRRLPYSGLISQNSAWTFNISHWV